MEATPSPVPPAAEVAPEQATDPAACVAGCGAAKDHPAPLSEATFHRLMKRFANEPVAEGSPALEALLFHHQDARGLLARRGPGPLDPGRYEALERELAREHAWIDVRVVDADGVERVRLGPHRVPLGIKQHIHPARITRLQPLEISGTVRRVGLYHLWSRL
jgi:hypothetical protein